LAASTPGAVSKVRVVVNGRVVRMKVAAKFIRRGLVVKPGIKRA
jgi:ribosomal protein L28